MVLTTMSSAQNKIIAISCIGPNMMSAINTGSHTSGNLLQRIAHLEKRRRLAGCQQESSDKASVVISEAAEVSVGLRYCTTDSALAG